MQTPRPSHGTQSGAPAKTSRTPSPKRSWPTRQARGGPHGLWVRPFLCTRAGFSPSLLLSFSFVGAQHRCALLVLERISCLSFLPLLANRVRKPAIIPKPLHGLPILHLHVRASVIFHLLDFRF